MVKFYGMSTSMILLLKIIVNVSVNLPFAFKISRKIVDYIFILSSRRNSSEITEIDNSLKGRGGGGIMAPLTLKPLYSDKYPN